MTLMKWKDEYALGIPAIDHEHKELIDLINQALESSTHDDSRDTVLDALGETYARISAHFALEEKLMREQEYDHYEDHKSDHERLLDEIRDIMDEYEDTSRFSGESFAHALEHWFTDHFRLKDARLHRRLR